MKCEIMEWIQKACDIHPAFVLGAQAALYYHYGIKNMI